MRELKSRDENTHSRVLDSLRKFEKEYQASVSNADLSPAFNFKCINGLPGQYRLHQVYATKDYRAILIIANGRPQAYWVHMFRKTKQNDRHEIDVGKARARRVWEKVGSQ